MLKKKQTTWPLVTARLHLAQISLVWSFRAVSDQKLGRFLLMRVIVIDISASYIHTRTHAQTIPFVCSRTFKVIHIVPFLNNF